MCTFRPLRFPLPGGRFVLMAPGEGLRQSQGLESRWKFEMGLLPIGPTWSAVLNQESDKSCHRGGHRLVPMSSERRNCCLVTKMGQSPQLGTPGCSWWEPRVLLGPHVPVMGDNLSLLCASPTPPASSIKIPSGSPAPAGSFQNPPGCPAGCEQGRQPG